MKCPTWLDAEGKAFFRTHSKSLVEEDRLTERTYPSFCLLCQVWSMIRNSNTEDPKAGLRFVGLLKQYERYAKPFGLFADKYTPKTESLADVMKKVDSGE